MLKTIILYLCTDENEIKAGHNNLPSVLEFLTKTDVSDYEEIFTKGRDDEDPVVKCYKAFAEYSNAKTIRQIPMGLYSRMQMFSGDNIKTLLSEDDFDGSIFTEEKTICYIEIPEADSSLSVVAALFISIMIHRMYPIYDDKKVSVRFILDELALIGPIYEFVENLAVARFQFTLIFQSIVQAKYLYPDNWEVVVGNCRGMGFLAPLVDVPTVEFISKILGSTTIKDGQLVDKKRFMDEKAIEKMESDKILFMRYGENPILLNKYYAH